MTMKRLFCKDIPALAEYMVNEASDGVNVTATLFFSDAVALMRELMTYEDIDVDYVKVMTEEYSGYNREYYVTLSEDSVLSVEPAWEDGRYLNTESDLILIDGCASHKIVEDIPYGNCRELYIGIEEDEDEDCCGDCCNDCSSCNKDMEDDELDYLFDDIELIYDSHDNVVGFSARPETVFKFLFR